MPKCNPFKTFAIAIAAALLAGHAQAAVITPVTATSTTTIGSPRTADAMIDGTLLSGGGTSGDILSETVTYAGSSGHWLSASSAVDDPTNFRSTTEVLTFDLGGTFDVDTMYLWPYIRAERARGIRTLDISFSTNGGTTYDTTLPAGTFADFTIDDQSGDQPVQTRSFAVQTDVTHIQLTNLTTFGSTNYIAISELRFGATEIPEPASLASGLLGLALIAGRRRR